MGERAHNVPKYKGGTMDDSNVTPDVPLEWHALQHKLIADSLSDGDDKNANLWSVNAIKKRMNFEELNEYFRLKELDERNKK